VPHFRILAFVYSNVAEGAIAIFLELNWGRRFALPIWVLAWASLMLRFGM